MNKIELQIKIQELEALKKKIETKKKEVEKELINLRSQLYKIDRVEKEKKQKEIDNRPPPNMDFLNVDDWGQVE